MSVAIITSFVQQCDSNGVPLNAGSVTVYAAGTTTPLTLYPNSDLTGSTTNPITLDASGRHAMAYIAAASYKILVKNSAGSTIYTRDNIDPGVSIGSGALAIENGGTAGNSAAAARTNLGVPSQTSFDDLSSDVTDISSTLAAIVGFPQGRLTMTSGAPRPVSDVTAGTAVYYTPYVGNQVPIYSGTLFVSTTFTELTLTLVSSHVASAIYDVFVINDSNTIRLATGPAWNTSTAGSGARGTGAGTTELEQVNGLLVNKNSMTARYGSSTTSVAARCGTYVGSIYMDGTNGQITCHVSAGQSRKWGVWNAYHRLPVILTVYDSTASWTYATASYRQSNGAAGNKATVFSGLQQDPIEAVFEQNISGAVSSSTRDGGIALGVDSTTSVSGRRGYWQLALTSTAGTIYSSMVARHVISAGVLGVSNVNCLEYGGGSGNSLTFNGTQTEMQMVVRGAA